MGKSSSSKRKRRSNAFSSARRRKSGRIKSRRMRSKKSSHRRRRHDLDSWSTGSDYDSSLSPSSDPYSISEDDYRRSGRLRSFSRKDDRKGRKRVRGDSHSFSSDEASLPLKRRKESKRKGGGSKSRRKSGRNRYRRDARDGYSSCSMCANRSGNEDEYESHRGRSEWRKSRVGLRDSRSRDRSGSCSSCHQCNRSSCGRESMFSGDSRSEERVTDENNSKRLRSVIVVVNAKEREGEEKKEEIVYDKDDYPSSRSNDSYDDERKKESAHDLCDVLDMKGMLESEKGKEVVSNLQGEPGRHGGNRQDGIQGNKRVSIGANHKDLESMLRQRALLKLQKLRGLRKLTTSQAIQEPTVTAAKETELPREDPVRATDATSRDSSDDTAEKSRIIKEKIVYVRPAMVPTVKQSGSSSEELVKRTVANVPRQAVLSAVAPAFSNPWRTAYTWRRESGSSQPPANRLISPQKHKPLQQKPSRTETNTTTNAAESPQKESALNPTKKLSLSQEPKPLKMKPMASETSNFKMELMATETTNSVSFVEESSRNELASSSNSVEKLTLPEIPKPFRAKPAAADQTSLSKAQQQSSLDADQSTDAKAAPGGVSSEKVVADVKEGPKYEQKTMSVTRGGETIQVNYQVYIPKRTPLARRQLKRDS